MSKPWGLTAHLQVIRPKPWEDVIWSAVEDARCTGVTWNQVEISDE